MGNKKANSRLFRWKLALLEYDFDIVHKAGAQNVVADALSRISIEDLITLSTEDKQVLITTRARANNVQQTVQNPARNRLYSEERNNILLNNRDKDHIFFIFNKQRCELQLRLELKIKSKLTNMDLYTAYKINDYYT